MEKIRVLYSDYINSVIEEINVELFPDILMTLKYDKENKNVEILMSDKVTANTELSGTIQLDELNVLIKTLGILRNQLRSI